MRRLRHLRILGWRRVRYITKLTRLDDGYQVTGDLWTWERWRPWWQVWRR